MLFGTIAEMGCQSDSIIEPTTRDNNNEMNVGCSTSLLPVCQVRNSDVHESSVWCSDDAVELNADIPSGQNLISFGSNEAK
ncbi:hypothetical protein D918_02073 [Trichuris suis]|nr:hypothetical protein D918_02073 [Trichuris suis]